MKKTSLLFIATLLSLCSCNIENNSEDIDSTSPSEEQNAWNIYDEDYSKIVNLSSLNDEVAKEYLPEDGTYESEDLMYNNVRYLETYVNNKKVNNSEKQTDKDDIKYIFYDNDTARLISLADGYAVSLPTETTVEGDFSLGKYRSKLYNEETTITISKETANPYDSWELYRDEWLIKFFKDKYVGNWMDVNRLAYTRTDIIFEKTSILQNYKITEYCVEIKEPGRITKPFYNIGIIRKSTSKKEFYLIVMKSTRERNDDFDKIIRSFKEIDSYGEANNSTLYNMENVENPMWNDATKRYYESLCSKETTDWGFYSGNLPGNGDVNTFNKTQKKYTDAFQRGSFEIVSSYSHVSYGSSFQKFPKEAAKEVCGKGIDVDGKPVLQFTFQFTRNNNNLGSNNVTDNFSPIFDILRGDNGNTIDFDSYQNDAEYSLNRLAKDIKEYGNPVLFRLNNEMNTDWTSYCGMINMIDPDLFAASWRVLYKIFEDNGVDNCIWIFNPFTPSCPYSSWGEDLCYFPGNKYVQVLGLTYYVMNNDNEATYKTFKECYTTVYNKNKDIWNKYPWIISEFGCGAGGTYTGELYRNETSQAKWVEDMFKDLNSRADYCKNIKGAVWFSVNDLNGTTISNALQIVPEKETKTVAAFIEGFKKE